MRIAADWLERPATQAVAAMLEAGGRQAWFVGGCVRNTLLRMPVEDVDVTTDAPPDVVTGLAEAAGLTVKPTGIAHGTVTVISDGVPHEVTTFRRDVETDGRRAVIAYASSLEADAARRDFTMNALYADRRGAVADPVGGIADLKERRVRFIGEPEARIREDYLRILRFFRFLAWIGVPGSEPDPAAMAACTALAPGVARLSAERVWTEVRKLLSAGDPRAAVAAMAAAGVLEAVLPGAHVGRLERLVALERAEALAPDAVTRLAALGSAGAADRLRLSKREAARLGAFERLAGHGATPAEAGYRLGAEDGARAVLLSCAVRHAAPAPGWRAEVARGAAAVFPVTAADLMPGVHGEALGRRLKALERAWVASGFRLDKAALLATG